MTKHDYIADVSVPEKWCAAVALFVATLVSATCLLLVVASAIIGMVDALRAFVGCLIFGLFTIICGWILVRMLRRQRASNGRTVIPEWFIQLFGTLFLICISTTAILSGRMWLFGEALGVAFAMIGVRSLLHGKNPSKDVANHRL